MRIGSCWRSWHPPRIGCCVRAFCPSQLAGVARSCEVVHELIAPLVIPSRSFDTLLDTVEYITNYRKRYNSRCKLPNLKAILKTL